MNKKDPSTSNLSSLSRTRTHSFDFSRHLFDSPRPKALTDKRPSKSFSDTDAMGLLGRTTHSRYQDFNDRKPKFVRQAANRSDRLSQKQVYNTNDSFHRKYGKKNERLDLQALPPATPMVNSPVNSVLHNEMNFDDDARSFCDSVSSIACSNVTNADVDNERKRKKRLSDKIVKFDVIETWLQQLPKPVI